MVARTFAVNRKLAQRLQVLSQRLGEAPEAILELALTDYE
jgi:hypothetical protein